MLNLESAFNKNKNMAYQTSTEFYNPKKGEERENYDSPKINIEKSEEIKFKKEVSSHKTKTNFYSKPEVNTSHHEGEEKVDDPYGPKM
jgi:hypothetical protein